MSATQIDVDGLRIRVAGTGRGAPLLLIMGPGGHLFLLEQSRHVANLVRDFLTVESYAATSGGR